LHLIGGQVQRIVDPSESSHVKKQLGGFFNSSSISTASTNGFSSNFSSFDDQGEKSSEREALVGEADEEAHEYAEEEVDEGEEEESEADDPVGSEKADTTTLLTAGQFSPFLSSYFHSHLSSASPPSKMPRKRNEQLGVPQHSFTGSRSQQLMFEDEATKRCQRVDEKDSASNTRRESGENNGMETIRIPDCRCQ